MYSFVTAEIAAIMNETTNVNNISFPLNVSAIFAVNFWYPAVLDNT